MLPSARLAVRHGCGATRRVHAIAASQQQSQQESAGERRQPAPPPPPPPPALSVLAATPTATQLLAAFFACQLRAADCYLLHGSVGAGKSYFSRAFIRAAAADDELPVPSPTFLLQNEYTEHEGPPIHHFDLYRLTQQYDLARLDLPSSFAAAVSLVEWPERFEGAPAAQQPTEPLDVRISIVPPAEQERLQQRLQGSGAAGAAAQQEPQEGGSGSSSSSSSEEDEEGSGGDTRWRRIQLAAAGPRWAPRLQLLRQYLLAEGGEVGCFVEEEGAAADAAAPPT